MRISDWSSDVCSSDLLGLDSRFGRVTLRAFGHVLQFVEDAELDIAAKLDVGAAPGHVGRDRDTALAARLGDDMRFPLVITGVQHGMLDVARGEEPGPK